METINPLLCDPETGICELPGVAGNAGTDRSVNESKKAVQVIYFTDPICSTCWGIEPQLRKLKLEYGDSIHIDYRMGGLLPDWNYNSGGISKPSDVAHHWDEVSAHYDMPIDGDVWLEDPLASSFPPSIAFKAAQLQDEHKAISFLRNLREMVFMEKKNITQWQHLETAALAAGLDVQQLKTHFEGAAKTLFEADLQLAGKMGVRGFPTLFFADNKGNTQTVYGAKPYAAYESAIVKLFPGVVKQSYPNTVKELFQQYNSLTANEFSVLSGTARVDSEGILNEFSKVGKLERFETKNGAIWRQSEM